MRSGAWLLLTLLWGSSLACSLEGGECRSSSDCAGSLECDGPSEPQVCGIPGNRQCSTDAECDPSMRCSAIYDPCSAEQIGSECRVPCTEDTGCAEAGLRCNADGACEAIPCDEGFACLSHEACDPKLGASRLAHGCVSISCSEDAQCPEQSVCVNGSCQEGPGSCVEPSLVP